jgi:xanthine dehydrogenase YagR molybdenum-binding subunit
MGQSDTRYPKAATQYGSQVMLGETCKDLLRRRGLQILDAHQTYRPEHADSMHPYGAVFAEVAVDSLLATVRIRRIYAVYDAGRIINPKLANSQAFGGMAQGIGMTLLESAEIDARDRRSPRDVMSKWFAE